MENDFETRVSGLAEEYLKRDKIHTNTITHTPEDELYLEVIDHLYCMSALAVDVFNSSAESEVLSVYKLPGEFLEMFLDITGRRGGFCLISPDKTVIFFDEDPNIITVIGKSRNTIGKENASAKTVQLFKISISKNDKLLEYRDNTGGVLDPYDIILVLVSWVTA